MNIRKLALCVVPAVCVAMMSEQAGASAFATSRLVRNTVSGTAVTSGGAFGYFFTGVLPQVGTAFSAGVRPAGTAFANSTASPWAVTAVATVTGVGRAGPEEPFLTPILPGDGGASMDNSVWGSRTGDMFSLSGTATFGRGGGLELGVLNTTGLSDDVVDRLLADHYSIERALHDGAIEPWRVLGTWRESSLTSGTPFSFTVNVAGIDSNNIAVTDVGHASSVPGPGALAVLGAGLVTLRRRRGA